ncbi:MAG TPA: BatD family protein [Thermoanaerobaculia bacterium]|nr:BatD family protein [Thermoanaerobaculia bacterium]
MAAAAFVCLAVAAPPLAAAPFAVQVSLQPAVIRVDEIATLTISAEGGGLGDFRFEPNYQLDNLEPVDGPSRYENLGWINGSFSHSFRFSIQLRPLAAGPARVRSLVLQVRGQLIRLPDQQIRVQPATAGQPGASAPGGTAGRSEPEPEDLFAPLLGTDSPLAQPPRAQGPIAFLRTEVQPPRPVVGEQAVYSVYLYSRQDVAAISPTSMPSFRGFWVRDLPLPAHLAPEMMIVGAERYGRVVMVRKALFALRPGPHLLEPAGYDVVVAPPDGGFFGPPLVRSEELHLRAPELAVEVQPLPAAPPGFSGLVGQVSMAATLKPYRLRVGEGATLTVTLAGAGNLQGAEAPRLEAPPDLTVFPPQRQAEDQPGGATEGGRRAWIFVIVPTRPGLYSVRPQPVLYFDPAHRDYRQAESPTLTLTALPVPAGVMAADAAGEPAAAHPGRRNGATPRERAGSWWPSLPRAWPPLPGTWPERLGWLVVLACMLTLAASLVRRRTARRRDPRWSGAAAAPAGTSPRAAAGRPQPVAAVMPGPGSTAAAVAASESNAVAAVAASGSRPVAAIAASGSSSVGAVGASASSPFAAVAASGSSSVATRATAGPPAGTTLAGAGRLAGASLASTAAAPPFPSAASGQTPAPPASLPAVESKLREAAREDRPRHAAALVEEGWRGYLAGRWGLPLTTPPARWGPSLAAHGVAAEIAGEMARLAEELHYLRHAPQLSTTGAVRDELLSRSRQLLRRLR